MDANHTDFTAACCRDPQDFIRALHNGALGGRRIKTEEKAKVVAAVRGTEFIQLLATRAISHQDDFEEKDE